MALPAEWFCTLLDEAQDVYFRYAIEPSRRLAYISPSIERLTGHAPEAFYADPALCAAVVVPGERHLIRRMLRARRGPAVTLHVLRDGVSVPVDLRTATVVRRGRIVAIEGVARLAIARGEVRQRGDDGSPAGEGPVQQRLAALMFEVHDLLHGVLPPDVRTPLPRPSSVLRYDAIEIDCDRLTVTESGQAVSLTTREVMVLRYFLERPGRVVTRQQLLEDVWAYHYTGDDRTVDVHLSRLRRKLPSLRGRLVAIRQVGYRLEAQDDVKVANG